MQVRISKPARSTMQSADGNGSWLLEFVKKPEKRFKEPVMGRTSSSDMSNAFAEKKTYQYEIIAPKEPKLPKKSYSDNFK
jgi:hypothetical protein